jgi:hypothetical protein
VDLVTLERAFEDTESVLAKRDRGYSWFADYQRHGRESTMEVPNFRYATMLIPSDLDPVDVANQWTLLEFNAIRTINPREFLNQVSLVQFTC